MWNRPFGNAIIEIEDEFRDRRDKTALYGYATLKRESPVLTGAYRRNHDMKVGSPNTSFSAGGERNISKVGGKPFDNVYLSTAAPYAQPIEDGISKIKAPDGVYGPTFSLMQAYVRAFR